MKKLFMLLAVAGIFASCSKETPVVSTEPKAQDQEAPITLSDGGADGEEGVRLSLRLDVEDFEEVAGGFDAAQQPRAVIPHINTGAANKKLINLRAYVDGEGGAPNRLTGMIYLYNKSGEVIPFNAPFRLYNDGKSIGYDGLVDGFPKNSGYRKIFDRMVAVHMRDCYVSVIIGNNPWGLNFTNKGPHVITSWDDNVELPKNFVMLKSEHNAVGWRYTKGGKVHEISTAGNVRMKLKMMGYLMMARIHNTFPQYVMRINPTSQTPYTDASGSKGYRALRPDLRTYLDVSSTLSVALDQQLDFRIDNQSKKGHFYMQSGGSRNANFIPGGGYLTYNKVLQVPVSTTPAGELPAKGDMVVAMYFPQVDDYGSVGIRLADNYFYDGSAFSLAPGIGYQTLGTLVDKFQKFKPTVGTSAPYRRGVDNKVYYPVFEVGPKTMSSTRPVKDPILSTYITKTKSIQWEAIP